MAHNIRSQSSCSLTITRAWEASILYCHHGARSITSAHKALAVSQLLELGMLVYYMAIMQHDRQCSLTKLLQSHDYSSFES